MNKMTRTQNSVRNIIVGVGGQAVETILRFVSRTIFIRFLVIEYLGINSLFTEILTVLSLAELGIGSAIIYALYKPLAEDDKEKISSLMRFYKKAYNLIGVFITVAGLAVLPFLDHIVDSSQYSGINISIIYCLFLFNTSVSYFFSYKSSLLGADQKNYISQYIKISFSFIKTILQILIIIITKNFYLYIAVQVVCTFLSNVVMSRYVDKHYSFIKDKNIQPLDTKIFKDLVVNVKSLVVIRISSILVNSTDNIIISMFNGIKSVGLMSNYTMIVQMFETLLGQIFDNVTGSIGNLNAQGDLKKSEKFFRVMNLLNFWLYGWISVGIIIVGNSVIKIWIGDDYLLSNVIVYIIAANFYIKGMQNAVWTYKNTYGLFKYGKFLLVFTAIVNLILSIVLGKIIGMAGILIATGISRLLTNVWYEPYAVYKYGLKANVITYYITYIKYIIILAVSIIATNYISGIYELMNIQNVILIFIFQFVAAVIIPNAVIILCVRKTEEYEYLKIKIQEIIKGYNGLIN